MLSADHKTGARAAEGPSARRHGVFALARVVAVTGFAAGLAGCYQTASAPQVADSYPADYRLRHPITIGERERTVEVFTGSGRGGLTPVQRAEVLSFAQAWKREATGGVVIDQPGGALNERAATDSLHEMRAILAAAGIPAQAVGVRGYRASAGSVAPIRLSYSKIKAEAGPCGLWPESLGPSFDASWQDNKSYWNFGCASQHNLAAMVANPEDLVQPRAEAATSTTRRNVVLEKYRNGQPTATPYPNPDKGKITDLGR